MKFEQALAQLIVEERLSTGLATILTWALDNYLGFLALKRIGKDNERIRLKDLPFEDFIYLLKFYVLWLYVPGLGHKRLRELRLAVMRFIDDHGYDYDFPFIEEAVGRRISRGSPYRRIW